MYLKKKKEDVLVRVGKLIVPVDFVVLDMGNVQENEKQHTTLLGRPFMATTSTVIDVKKGTTSMTVLGESIAISVREGPPEPQANVMEECAYIRAIEQLTEDACT